MTMKEKEEVKESPYVVQKWIINSTGRKIYCNPLQRSKHNRIVKMIEDNHREAGNPIDKPTYFVPFESGDDIEYEHDENTLEDKNNPEETEENKKAWTAHVLAYNEMMAEINEAVLKWLCVDGIDFKKSSKDFPKWKESQEFIGILPVNKNEQQLAYISDNLIVTVSFNVMSDFMLTIENCFMLAMEGPTSEMVALARADFRGNVSK